MWLRFIPRRKKHRLSFVLKWLLSPSSLRSLRAQEHRYLALAGMVRKPWRGRHQIWRVTRQCQGTNLISVGLGKPSETPLRWHYHIRWVRCQNSGESGIAVWAVKPISHERLRWEEKNLTNELFKEMMENQGSVKGIGVSPLSLPFPPRSSSQPTHQV